MHPPKFANWMKMNSWIQFWENLMKKKKKKMFCSSERNFTDWINKYYGRMKWKHHWEREFRKYPTDAPCKWYLLLGLDADSLRSLDKDKHIFRLKYLNLFRMLKFPFSQSLSLSVDGFTSRTFRLCSISQFNGLIKMDIFFFI